MVSHNFQDHLVRIGLFGHVGRFRSVDAVAYPRGSRVVCRTSRGLELGEVLSGVPKFSAQQPDGSLLRGVMPEDDLLLARLKRHKERAYLACQRLLSQRGLSAVLMDVEHLFDGKSLYFYFLGDVTPELESLTGELTEAYESQVRFRKFAETIVQGCGPGCGTESAAGAGCGSNCSSCAVSGTCPTREISH